MVKEAQVITIGLLIAFLLGGMWFKEIPLLDEDIKRVGIGLYLSSPLLGGSIGCHAIGNIGYYSKKRIIDFLGKIDTVISHQEPKQEFSPGHDKWDYEYSINKLKPDIIVPQWTKGLNLRNYSKKGKTYHRK